MTNGASQDIQEATAIARNMVAMFGMSDQFGMMALASKRNQYLDGGYSMTCAQETYAAADRETIKILRRRRSWCCPPPPRWSVRPAGYGSRSECPRGT